MGLGEKGFVILVFRVFLSVHFKGMLSVTALINLCRLECLKYFMK